MQLTEGVIQSPHFSEEDKSKIKRLVNECSQKEEERMLIGDYLNNMSMQYFKQGIPENDARWLKREMKRIVDGYARLSSDIMNTYVCGMGPIFERLVKIKD